MRENAIRPLLVCAKEWAALLATLSLYNTCLSVEAAACVGEGVLGKTITVSGVCPGYAFSSEANGAYELQGTTSDGREYYANAAGNGQYLFYDAECTGAETFPARWMITYLKPNITATEGLVDCHTPGAYLETSAQTLPSNASWQMHNCKYRYEFFSHTLSISSPTCTCKVGYSGENCEIGSAPPACDGEGAVGKQMNISGACVIDGTNYDLNGVYKRQGTTADGREHYKKKGSTIYLFYDANCGAEYNQPSPAGWYITTFEPNITATQGLADYPATLNNGCAYGSKFATTATTLPSSGAWQMSCDKKRLDLGGTSDSDSVLSISPPTCICASGYTNCDGTTTTVTLTTLTATSTATATATAATAAATITTTTTATATSVAVISTTTSNTTATNGAYSTTTTPTTNVTTTPTTNGATMLDASTTLAAKTTAPGQTTTTTPTPSVDSSNETNSGRTTAVVVAVIVVLLAAAVGGWWCFSGQLCCSTAHGNGGGDLDGFRNETIEMMDNPMRAASVGRGGAADAARYSGYEPPMMDQNASAGVKSSSTIIYAVPAEEPEDGVSAVARVPNPIYQPADGPSTDNRTLARTPNPMYEPADGPSTDNRTLVRTPNPVYQPASNSMHDAGVVSSTSTSNSNA